MRSGPVSGSALRGSLRFRLTIWNTLVVLILVSCTLWGVREGLRYVLWHEADEQLIEDGRELVLTFEQLHPDLNLIRAEFDRKAATHTHRGLFIQVFGSQGDLLWINSASRAAAPSPEDVAVTARPVTAGENRVIQVLTSRPGVPPTAIRIGVALRPLEDDIAVITRLILGAGGVALFLAPLGGYWLSGRATRPVAEIIETTRRLHPGNLDERLTLRGTNDELDRLAATINGFLDRLALYLQQNREFTGNAAHELRSPLAAIQNSLEVALNTDRSVGEYKDLLADVLEECGNLRILVNQLLLLAENDATERRDNLEVVRFDQIVQRGFDMFLGAAESAGIELWLSRLEPAPVRGDSSRLRQVVNNLIDNAIKYTSQGGVVRITLAIDREKRTVRLSVSDTGMGIPPEDLPRVFDRFFRGDRSRARAQPTRGTGLGLAICKSIVESHDGSIDIESVLDRGTTVTVTLPACEAPRATVPSVPETADTARI